LVRLKINLTTQVVFVSVFGSFHSSLKMLQAILLINAIDYLGGFFGEQQQAGCLGGVCCRRPEKSQSTTTSEAVSSGRE